MATGNWDNSTIKTSDFNAGSYLKTRIENRNRSQGGSYGPFQGIGDLPLVGISIAGVTNIKREITIWVGKIKKQIDKLEDKTTLQASPDNAYKSKGNEVENAVNQYLAKVKDYLIFAATDLNAFKDKLDDVLAAWQQSTSNLAGTINEDTASVETGTAYQSQNSVSSSNHYTPNTPYTSNNVN